MALYALILNSQVVQLANATFPVAAPLLWTGDISAVTPAPQVGCKAEQDGGTWTFTAAQAAPEPTLAQQATAQLAAGVAVMFATSTGLNATYATTLVAQVKIMAEANWLIKNNSFINGTTTLVLVDASGTQRSFNPTQFAAFEAAYAPYVSAVDLVADSNQGTLPAAMLTVSA
jgi:hypothetical protein